MPFLPIPPPHPIYFHLKFFLIFKYILLIMLLELSHFFSSLFPSTLYPHPPSFPQLSSCPWVIHINSLASPFPVQFLTSLCLFDTYHLCFLFPIHFPPFSPLTLPADNPPCDLHFRESPPLLVVRLVHFCFCF